MPDVPPARRRRIIYILAALALLAFIALLVWRAGQQSPTTPPAGPPTVSIIVPGLVATPDRVSATGSIDARDNMPIGITGEGGKVARTLAEAGDRVRAGQVLAEIDTSVQRAQLQQLKANVLEAKANASLAQNELERAQALVSRGFISQADIDRRTATRDAARAQVTVAEARVREMEQRLVQLSIRSPKDGIVLARNVSTGQVVGPGSGTLYQVAANGTLEVKAKIAEQDMAGLSVGQSATVTPIGSHQSFHGTIWLLEPLIDPETRQGIARIALPWSPDLRVGGFANVVLEGTEQQRPIIPQSALLSDNQGNHVLIVNNENKVERRNVTVGEISPAGLVVTDGLNGSEQVVSSAGAFLTLGEEVRPVRTEDDNRNRSNSTTNE